MYIGPYLSIHWSKRSIVQLSACCTMQMVRSGTKVNLHSKMFWREKYIPYTVTQTYSVRSFTAQTSKVNVLSSIVLLWGTFCSFLPLFTQFLCSVLHRSKSCSGAAAHAAGSRDRRVRCICWPGSEHRSLWTLCSLQLTDARTAESCGDARPSPAASVQPAETAYHHLSPEPQLLGRINYLWNDINHLLV